jgi:hypothetical protein
MDICHARYQDDAGRFFRQRFACFFSNDLIALLPVLRELFVFIIFFGIFLHVAILIAT